MDKVGTFKFVCASILGIASVAMPVASDAATYRGRLDPLFGSPFISTNLFWDVDIQLSLPDSCVQSGLIFNVNCGPMTVDFAKVNLSGTVGSVATTEVLTFTPSTGYVAGMRFDTTLPVGQELTGAVVTPFAPVQSTTSLALYPNSGGSKSFFSLVLLDKQVQLYWFEKNPGTATVNPTLTFPYIDFTSAPRYAPTLYVDLNGPFPPPPINLGGCGGTGVNSVIGFDGKCGWSSNTDGPTGEFITFTLVPEPEAYAMALASMGTIGVMGFISRRRKSRAVV